VSLGFDAVLLARRGARVTGADFSASSLTKAREIAVRCEVQIEYLHADSLDLPTALHGRFDLVYATIGVIGWIGDLDFPYEDAGPQIFDQDGSYANSDAVVAATQTIEHAHSLGEVVTATIGAGMRVEALREHLAVEHDPRGTFLMREDDGIMRLRLGGMPVPILFTLVAATEQGA
jgi:predicted TPR repeat methyltransferase